MNRPRPAELGPVRMCIGCRRRDSQKCLVRLAIDGVRVVVDESGTLPGRGAYLHRDQVCVDETLRRQLIRRAFRGSQISAESVEELAAELTSRDFGSDEMSAR